MRQVAMPSLHAPALVQRVVTDDTSETILGDALYTIELDEKVIFCNNVITHYLYEIV